MAFEITITTNDYIDFSFEQRAILDDWTKTELGMRPALIRTYRLKYYKDMTFPTSPGLVDLELYSLRLGKFQYDWKKRDIKTKWLSRSFQTLPNLETIIEFLDKQKPAT